MIVDLILISLQILAGWMLADFITGLLHWAEDRLGPGREHWPIIGALIFTPNILHHESPSEFLRSSFFDRNWTTWAAVLVIGLLFAPVFGVQVWLIAAIVGGAISSEIHAWAHDKRRAPFWVLPLQNLGLLQSPRHHAVHHVPDHRRNYCILTDWLNPLLESVRFWEGLERLLPKGVIR